MTCVLQIFNFRGDFDSDFFLLALDQHARAGGGDDGLDGLGEGVVLFVHLKQLALFVLLHLVLIVL